VPRPISFAASVGKSEEGRQGGTLPCVLGAGAELKNAPCLTRGTDAFVCQHTGDMEDAGTAAFHEEAIDHTARLLHVAPEIIVRDMHPDSLSGRIAEDYAGRSGLPVLRLQHHFAHAHALLAENGHAGKALALVLDGSGFGSDGTLWGGELLFLDPHPAGGGLPEHRRLARLAPLDLPGGDAAVREPWRIAHALLLRLGLIDGRGAASFSLPWLPDRKFAADMLPAMLPAVPSAILMPSGGIMTDGGLNTPRGSGCGRLFDAVSALLGLCLEASYEGQGAIRLEEAQGVPPPASDLSFPDPSFPDPSLPDPVLYPCPLLPDPEQGEAGLLLLDTRALFRALCEDLARAVPVALLARRFHRSLAAGLVEAAAFLAAEHGLQTAGLSGGCMLNMTLSELLREGLEKKGMTVLEHGALPPGDGCIGFGQAVYGALVSVVMKRGCETE
jgi:hydrogenase maturation protein HypF